MEELFELLTGLVSPFDWLLGLFGNGGPTGDPTGDPTENGPAVAELQKAIARENRRRKVAQLAGLESDRRAGRLSLAEFRRRYAGLARGEPSDDPAQSGPYGPNTEALKGFIDRVRAMDRAQWDLAEAHLRNLHANSVVRKALLPRYRSALDAAAATARRLLRNGAERSGGQAVRMRPGRRAPEHAY